MSLLMSFMDGPQVIRNQIEKDLLPLDYRISLYKTLP